MRSICWFLPVVMCVTVGAQKAGPDPAPDTTTYITHVTVIDTETGKEAADRTVIVAGGKISDVRDSKTAAPVSAKVVDGRGKFLTPGLWDMHVHGTNYDSTLPLYIANGVTGVREMFGPPDANKFRADLAAKRLIAPHIYLGSPIVDGKPPVWPNSIAVETADEARKVVDEQKQRGADFIKVYSLLSREAYFAIVDEARRQNIPVDGHVPNSVTVLEATAAKQRTIEHLIGMELACSSREKDLRPKILAAKPIGIEFDALVLAALQSYSDLRCKGLFAELRENGSWPVPTLAVWRSVGLLNNPQFTSDNRVRYFSGEFRDWVTGKADPRTKEWSASEFGVRRDIFTAESKLTGELFRAGVPMLAGTDVGNAFCFPGFSLHDELALLVESGVSPLGALQMATRNPALFMDASDKYGSVTLGKIADLVLLDADPLQDIHNTTKIRAVFLAGKEFDRPALDSILRVAEAAANQATNTAEESQESEEVQRLKMPGPDVQNLMLGSWVINVKYPPTSERSGGDTGVGTEVWRAGPGGRSVIEEYREKDGKGNVEGLGVAWWDKQAQGQRFVWCDTSNPDGCYVSEEVAKWNGESLEWKEEQVNSGKKRVYSEIFKNIRPDSFTQVLQEGEPGKEMKTTATILATKIGTNPEAELRAIMAERRRASIEGDVEAIASSMTGNYLQTDIYGNRQNKTAWLNEYFKPLAELIKTGKFHWDVYEQKELQFRFYEDSAVVTGTLEAKGTGAKPGPRHTWVADPDASFSGTLHFTHIYIKQNRKWLLAALHNQLAGQPQQSNK